MGDDKASVPRIRPYRTADRLGVYQVCLHTGDAGGDASCLYRQPLVLGDVYVGPYLEFQPELAWVLEDEIGVCGYILGVADTKAYQAFYLGTWSLERREQYPYPNTPEETWTVEDGLMASFHEPDLYVADWMEAYPAHLHMDLVSRVQGKGYGPRMMALWLEAIEGYSVAGVHLGMHPENERALRFYARMGFHVLEKADSAWEEALYLGKSLKAGSPSVPIGL